MTLVSAEPITLQVEIGFGCLVCPAQFYNRADLEKHVFKEHDLPMIGNWKLVSLPKRETAANNLIPLPDIFN